MLSHRESSGILSKVEVAKPCPANWRDMTGNDQVRHCTHCAKNVYDLSSMSRQEAANLIIKTEGKVCVRYFARADGRIMTKDCARRVKKAAGLTHFVLTILGVLGLSSFATAFQSQQTKKATQEGYFMGFISSHVRHITKQKTPKRQIKHKKLKGKTQPKTVAGPTGHRN